VREEQITLALIMEARRLKRVCIPRVSSQFQSHVLAEGARIEIGRLLRLRELGNYTARANDPSNSKPGSEDLGERAKMEHGALGVVYHLQ